MVETTLIPIHVKTVPFWIFPCFQPVLKQIFARIGRNELNQQWTTTDVERGNIVLKYFVFPKLKFYCTKSDQQFVYDCENDCLQYDLAG